MECSTSRPARGIGNLFGNPELYIDANVTGTLHLLRRSVEHGVPKFILSSTSSLYGGDHPRPFVETLSADRPLSPTLPLKRQRKRSVTPTPICSGSTCPYSGTSRCTVLPVDRI
jgi:nucleoside-diphosphate-sugar epimerase